MTSIATAKALITERNGRCTRLPKISLFMGVVQGSHGWAVAFIVAQPFTVAPVRTDPDGAPSAQLPQPSTTESAPKQGRRHTPVQDTHGTRYGDSYKHEPKDRAAPILYCR